MWVGEESGKRDGTAVCGAELGVVRGISPTKIIVIVVRYGERVWLSLLITQIWALKEKEGKGEG